MEYFDIVDEQGNPTGQTVERKQAHRNNILHRTCLLYTSFHYCDIVCIIIAYCYIKIHDASLYLKYIRYKYLLHIL